MRKNDETDRHENRRLKNEGSRIVCICFLRGRLRLTVSWLVMAAGTIPSRAQTKRWTRQNEAASEGAVLIEERDQAVIDKHRIDRFKTLPYRVRTRYETKTQQYGFRMAWHGAEMDSRR